MSLPLVLFWDNIASLYAVERFNLAFNLQTARTYCYSFQPAWSLGPWRGAH